MRKNRIGCPGVAVLSFLLAVGCASTAKYDAKLNALIGHNTAQLEAKMGRPSARKFLSDGREVWAYTQIENDYVPSEFYLYDQGALANEYGGLYTPFMDQYDFSPYEQNFGYRVEYICVTAFLIQNDTVIAWKWRGNNCVAD